MLIDCHDSSAPNALPTGYIRNRVVFIAIYLLDLNLTFPESLESYSNLSAVFGFFVLSCVKLDHGSFSFLIIFMSVSE